MAGWVFRMPSRLTSCLRANTNRAVSGWDQNTPYRGFKQGSRLFSSWDPQPLTRRVLFMPYVQYRDAPTSSGAAGRPATRLGRRARDITSRPPQFTSYSDKRATMLPTLFLQCPGLGGSEACNVLCLLAGPHCGITYTSVGAHAPPAPGISL